MSATTLVTMILILGFVWGGLIVILVTAAARERAKGGLDPDEGVHS